MVDSTKCFQREALLQEGVSCALATVHVIEAADLFRDLPEDRASRDKHNHGSWLLAMLSDQLHRLQHQVDELSNPEPVAAAQREG